ncbi:MAG: ArsI/CadI family heavy metal resistance metalloenzyme [Terriglobales bacterium]
MSTHATPSKVHVSLDTKDINQSIRYYATLFNMEPTKVKPGYAKFDVADPAINLTLGQTSAAVVTGPNHMGIRVNSIEEVIAAKDRLEKAGFTTMDEMGTTCCYAVQDKVWSADPSGNRWEVYIFKGDAEKFGGASTQNSAAAHNNDCAPGGACCSDVIAEGVIAGETKAAAKASATTAATAKASAIPNATAAAGASAAPKAEKTAGAGAACCVSDSRSPEEQKTACC